MDIGKTLQDTREARNLSLDTVAQDTNIRKVYLEAIEQNDFASLSGDVFVKGVMRTYGNYLGLDGALLVEEYKAARAGNMPVKNNNTIRESRNVKVRPTFKSNRDIGSGNGGEHRLLLLVAGILAVLLAVAGGFYFYLTRTGQPANVPLPFRFGVFNIMKEKNTDSALKAGQTKENGTKTDEKNISDKNKLSVKEDKPDSKNRPEGQSLQAAAAKKTAAANGRTYLKLTSTGKCWLRVTDQKGTVLFEGNLLKGESKSFSSNSDIVMRIGNLKELQIEHNGKVLPFEEPKEAVTRIYTPAKT